MYIVTGGFGFVGSNIVRKLASMGERVVIVDTKTNLENKMHNISNCVSSVLDVIEPDNFRATVEQVLASDEVRGVFHQGACTDTTVTDAKYMLEQNFDFSKELIVAALKTRKNIVYASSAAVYGDSTEFGELDDNKNPLNVYGLSKILTDNFSLYLKSRPEFNQSTVVGLRYFNVYGRNENHKGKMASMVHQLLKQACTDRTMKLFRQEDEIYTRDFVSVDDVVKVNLHFMYGKPTMGVYNVGTGVNRTFTQICDIIKKYIPSNIQYVDMPDEIKKFYQKFTKADLKLLREAGFTDEFESLEDGMKKLIEELYV